MDVRRDENYRESWWVTNRTNKTITIGDLLLLPVLKPGKRVDLLRYYTREKISHSLLIPRLVKARIITLNKDKIYDNALPGNITPAEVDEAITPAEENELGAIGGDSHTHDNDDILDEFSTDSAGNLLWNNNPIEGVGVSIHNDLDGLQGGDDIADEYYHLTYEEYDSLTGGPDENADHLHSHEGVANIDGGFPDSTYGGGVDDLRIDGGDPWGNTPSA